jgi:hypothetical protein
MTPGNHNSDEVNGSGIIIRYELVGVIVMMLIQSLTAVWWASGVTANMKYLTDEIKDIKASIAAGTVDRYKGSDAAKDREVLNDRINAIDRRLQSIIEHGTPITDKRISLIEYKLGIPNGSRAAKDNLQ